MSTSYTAVGLTGTQNSPHMGAVFNGNSLLVCQTDTLARAERIAGFLNGDAGRLEQADRIISALWPLSATVLEAFGKYMDAKDKADLMWAVAEAQKFLESNRSHG